MITNLFLEISDQGKSPFRRITNHKEKSICITIVPTSDNREITSISYVANLGETIKRDFSDQLDQLYFQLSSDLNSEKQLLDRILEITESDDETTIQKSIDSFVLGISAYLVTINLLSMDEFWKSKAFQVDTWSQYKGVEVSTLNQNFFQHLRTILKILITVFPESDSVEKTIFREVIGFLNGWGHIFEQGPIIDRTESMMDLLNNYFIFISVQMENLRKDRIRFAQEMESKKNELLHGYRFELLNAEKSDTTGLLSLSNRVDDLSHYLTTNPFSLFELNCRVAKIEALLNNGEDKSKSGLDQQSAID
jgi:hypothetical protein